VTIDFDTSMHLVDLVADGFDLAVRLSPPTDSSLVARKVASRRMIVCASPEYLAKHGTPRDPDELRHHNCLSLPEIRWRFLYPDSVRNVKIRGSLISNNGRMLVAAAVKGIGIVRFTEYYMRDEISRGELQPLLESFEVQDAATWIVYADRHHMPTRVRLLIDFLVERLRLMDAN
jgi:DNA-binding transcriptional LysR family regulator